MKYKLNYFNLNKQSLKRKIKIINNNVTNIELLKLYELLNQKETNYNLDEIKYIVNTLYNNLKVNKDEPLSRYYNKLNKEKYLNLIDLIEIEEDGHVFSKINRDIKKLHQDSIEYIYDISTLIEKQKQISIKYSIKMSQIEKIFNDIEVQWLTKHL